MQKKKLNDHQFDVDYDPNRPISFPNDCHLGSQSVLTWPVVKKIAGDGQDKTVCYRPNPVHRCMYDNCMYHMMNKNRSLNHKSQHECNKILRIIQNECYLGYFYIASPRPICTRKCSN